MAVKCLITGLSALPLGLLAEQQGLVLIQNRATAVQRMDGLGSTAPLTEEGYQQVAALKNNHEMKAFAYRLLSTEARYVSNEGELTGAIHWYSGRLAIQDLNTLKKELRRAWWTKAGEGRTAPLNEKGYQAVAAMKSNAHMRAFMRRILDADEKKVVDVGAFDAMAPYYDGEISVQNFDKLRQELLSVEWAIDKNDNVEADKEEFVSDAVDEMLAQDGEVFVDGGLGSTAPLNQEGYEQVAALVSNKEMKKFAHRILKSEARYAANLGDLTGAMHWYSGRRSIQDFESLKAELRRAWWTKAGEGRTAPLNEKGYQAVAAMKSNAHMRAFMRRILNAANKKVTDVDAFDAMAPFYDGEYSTEREQSFEQLQQELLAAPWAVERDSNAEISTGLGSEVVDEMLVQIAIASVPAEKGKKKSGGECREWCTNQLFAKIEENTTVAKNISSWEMKCSWYYCNDCGACKDPSLHVVERHDRKHQAKHMFEKKDASCEEWCSSEKFIYTHHNQTQTGHFTWEMKCGWQYCAACKKCQDHE